MIILEIKSKSEKIFWETLSKNQIVFYQDLRSNIGNSSLYNILAKNKKRFEKLGVLPYEIEITKKNGKVVSFLQRKINIMQDGQFVQF